MKVLICTTTFSEVGNGPTKFVRLLYHHDSSQLETYILTEDVTTESERLLKCGVKIPKILFWFGPVIRMLAYFRVANNLNKVHNFDFIIYNNAIYAIFHAMYKKNIVGFINDDLGTVKTSNILGVSTYENIRHYVFGRLESWAVKYCKIIVTNSGYMNALLAKKYPKYSDKFKVLYKGIELRNDSVNVAHRELSEVTKPIRILFVKNNFVVGGLYTLLRAIADVDLKFILTVIGPEKGKKEEILNSVPQNVLLNFLGRQKQEIVFKELLNSHIFCVPSKQEALGVANIEAISLGVPVVSTNVGGIPEVLDYGKCGFLAEPGCHNSLKEQLLECIVNEIERETKIKYGIQHAQKFDMNFTVQNLYQLLQT